VKDNLPFSGKPLLQEHSGGPVGAELASRGHRDDGRRGSAPLPTAKHPIHHRPGRVERVDGIADDQEIVSAVTALIASQLETEYTLHKMELRK